MPEHVNESGATQAPLPEIRFRIAPGPPIWFPVPPVTDTPPLAFGIAALPATLVPIVLP